MQTEDFYLQDSYLPPIQRDLRRDWAELQLAKRQRGSYAGISGRGM